MSHKAPDVFVSVGMNKNRQGFYLVTIAKTQLECSRNSAARKSTVDIEGDFLIVNIAKPKETRTDFMWWLAENGFVRSEAEVIFNNFSGCMLELIRESMGRKKP